MNIKKKAVGSNRNIKKHGLLFRYNIKADPLLGVGYVEVRRIPCICSGYLSKLDSPRHRIQDNYNQDIYKGENKNCVYWTILGSYKNWHMIHYIESRKQQKSLYA